MEKIRGHWRHASYQPLPLKLFPEAATDFINFKQLQARLGALILRCYEIIFIKTILEQDNGPSRVISCIRSNID